MSVPERGEAPSCRRGESPRGPICHKGPHKKGKKGGSKQSDPRLAPSMFPTRLPIARSYTAAISGGAS
jgi:hypothetical protein